MPSRKKHHGKKKGGPGKHSGPRRRNADGPRPTVVLRSHTLIAQTLTNTNLKQLNIVPNLGITAPDIQEQAKFFQTYRILSVMVHFLNLDPVNQGQIGGNLELPYYYEVSLTSNVIPIAAESAYLAFKNVKLESFRRDFKRSFKPLAYTEPNDQGPVLRSPRIPCTDLLRNHYGLSFLFIKPSATVTTYTIRATITMQIAFYTYDGNNGVATKNLAKEYELSQWIVDFGKTDPPRVVAQDQSDSQSVSSGSSSRSGKSKKSVYENAQLLGIAEQQVERDYQVLVDSRSLVRVGTSGPAAKVEQSTQQLGGQGATLAQKALNPPLQSQQQQKPATIHLPVEVFENEQTGLFNNNFLTRDQVLALLARYGVQRNPGPKVEVDVDDDKPPDPVLSICRLACAVYILLVILANCTESSLPRITSSINGTPTGPAGE